MHVRTRCPHGLAWTCFRVYQGRSAVAAASAQLVRVRRAHVSNHIYFHLHRKAVHVNT